MDTCIYAIIFTQETIELNSTDHSLVVLDMAVANDQQVVDGESIDDQGAQSVVVLSSYEDWSSEEKLYIVELAKTQNLDAICQLFGLSAEVVCSWVQDNEGSNETFTAPVILNYPEELDIALRDWVLSEQSQYKFISTKMLQEQASLLIQPQCPEFNPSMGWLHQFLIQNGLALQLSIPSEHEHMQCIYKWSLSNVDLRGCPKFKRQSMQWFAGIFLKINSGGGKLRFWRALTDWLRSGADD